MKVLPISLLISLLSISFSGYAVININFDRDIQLLAVNGESEGVNFGHRSELTLDPGEHQLLVRTERIIQMSGKQNKYKSPLMVLKVSGDSGVVNLTSAMTIRDESNAREFDRRPSLNIEVTQGDLVIDQDFIPGRSFAFMGDYTKQLRQFNRTESKAAINDVSMRSFTTHPTALVKDVPINKDKLKAIQKIYLELDENQQKSFLSWAVSQ
ncbi:MAG: DUF2057 family protein [Vibrio metschnikovii]|uniref:DUF2057 family protein n=1 Tax=Vibrio TaxID=662 RepID=UPI0001B9532F|nr:MULTISPECIES: DUF2057 family protein [Vibrio]EEX37593.1 VvgS protein [Vibrio metschnikovii CIP 69.14]EKO3565733.1 DUF2057 domain-containing protein [Vibrio metschnikovii]EKO3768640.1 DUF2057 domain-containing protein [Vibrio metschnikovii]MBC3617392.1 DUF2057 domain-containing protein [Vibrio metschnikovii]MBC5813457.1 DUF2057 domain-containing protein [Vibrio metschnikovii]